MEDTCFEKCWRFKDRETCENHMELVWKSDTNEVKTTHDCAPRRTLITQLSLESRFIGLQKASEQERNQSHQVVGALVQLADAQGLKLSVVKNILQEPTPCNLLSS